MNPKNINIVLHHSPCLDGQSSGWVAHRYAKLNNLNYIICGIETNGKPEFTPEVTELIKDQVVLFVDYAPNKAQYEIAKSICKDIYIIDHHKTNEAFYKDKPNTIFNMNKSGVGLAWEFFFPDVEMPLSVQLIQDMDLWKLSLPHSREFNVGYDYETYGDFTRICTVMDDCIANRNIVNNLINAGTNIQNYKLEKIKETVNSMLKANKFYTYNGYKALLFNAGHELANDIGDMALQNTEVEFVVIWRYSHETELYTLSLRSCNRSPVDVSEIAKEENIYKPTSGGGHRNAAGCNLNIHPSIYFSKKIENNI